MNLVDPLAGKIGKRRQVLCGREPSRLEPPHLARRGCTTMSRLPADDPSHRGIMAQPLGVVDVLVSGKPTERHVIPTSLEWFLQQRDHIRERILEVHRPIPGNTFGTKFHTRIQFASSISDQRLADLTREHLGGLPQMYFFPSRGASIGFGRERRETKILAAGKPVSFDEEASAERYVKIPAPAPTFLNASGSYARGRWVNLIVPSESNADDTALVYPSNIWSPEYPNLSAGDLRIGREGWALNQEHSIGYSLLRPQTGREAIIGF
jgi:hypothetical protein